MGHERESMVSRSAAVKDVLAVRGAVFDWRKSTMTSIMDRLSGSVLADSVTTPIDVPAHDYATIDGSHSTRPTSTH